MKYAYLASPPIQEIFIDKSLKDSLVFRNIIENIKKPVYQSTKISEIEDYKSFIHNIQHDIYDKTGKTSLLLYPEKGQFLHPCPGSDGVVCCRYFVLDLA